ncbi:uncharacterized protein [Clytia hemisphaerica]|uniref:Uncharacterized protein n=1 Tax=Clytia hemisphaerica TaxID=252671 RepID=A0A7M5WVH2_9CNID
MAAKKCLNFEIDYFVDIARQIAYKRFIHKKYWNVVLHAVASVLVVWSAFFISSCFLPYFLCHLNLIFILVLCIVQDVHAGLASLLVYPVLYYHALYVTDATFLQVVSLAILIYIIQNFVGQQWIECVDQITQNTIKSVDPNFLAADLYNEVFLSFYHNMITLLIRMDFRMDLHDRSNVALRQVLDRMKKTP